MVVVEVERSEKGRAETYAFLRSELGSETIFGLIAGDVGVPAVVVSARASGQIVGGVYFSPDFESMSEGQSPGLDLATRRRGWQSMWALHGIAVAEGHRRSGLASALISKVEEIAEAQGAELITGVSVTGEDADAFYRARGYEVGPLQWPLIFKFDAGASVLIQQDDPNARWFWKRLRAGGASALSPTARQRELFARAAENG